MKKILFGVLALSVGWTTPLLAQGEMDVYKLSGNHLVGTARSVSMGGAFGALGGDLGGVAINPEGIGVYRGSEFVATLNFQNTASNLLGDKFNKSRLDFSSIGYVANIQLYDKSMSRLNLGFSYNRLKSFGRKYTMEPGSQGTSLTDYIAKKSQGISVQDLRNSVSSNGFTPVSGVPWLSILGYQSYLINPASVVNNEQLYQSVITQGETVAPLLDVEEKGGVNRYDFTIGTSFSDKLNIGLSLSVTDLDYELNSTYEEGFLSGTNNGFALNNYLRTTGSGFQVGVGAIYRPVDELRIGVSYQSPTWYQMSDNYAASMEENVAAYTTATDYASGKVSTGGYQDDYQMRTPDKWTFSVATILGKKAIVSLDYEVSNYKLMELSQSGYSSAYADVNRYIQEDFRTASALRLGAEYRFTPRFSGRLGYAWQQSPMKADYTKQLANEIVTAGTVTQFSVDGNSTAFTCGLGYRLTKTMYLDAALVTATQKSKLYAFSPVFDADNTHLATVPSADLKTSQVTGLLTLGVKF